MWNISGIIGILIFYVIIIVIGIWASKKKNDNGEAEEEIMLAGRNIGLVVGVFTMTGAKKRIKTCFSLIGDVYCLIFSYMGRRRLY